MSDGLDRPHTDADAWATACAEDLAAEKARRREQTGYRPGSAADELRKLAEAVADKVAELRSPAAGLAAQAVISQVKAAVDPIKDRNPDLFEHLTAAGAELLAAYRSAVTGQEQRWTRGTRPAGGTGAAPGAGTGSGPASGAAGDPGGTAKPGESGGPGDDDDPGRSGPERIDLD